MELVDEIIEGVGRRGCEPSVANALRRHFAPALIIF